MSQDQEVYFLEMNIQLQMEHDVTEMSPDWASVAKSVRAQVCPEYTESFIPQIGTVTNLHLSRGEYVRVDSPLCRGYEVTLHYEPLLAKIMAWGAYHTGSLPQWLQDYSERSKN